MKVQIGFVTSSFVSSWLPGNPRIEAMAEFPGGGLGGGPETLRQSKVLSSSIYHILVLYAGHSMSFIPGFFTTKS